MHRLKTLIISAFFLSAHTLPAQTLQRPKLVVGIVVDQMRWDYLYRYYDRYSPDGFKRMLTQGFSCENAFIPYTPTYTAAGHTSVYTGSVPAINGIIGNSWYRRDIKRSWYCAEDTTVRSVGSTSSAGKMSPRNMWTTTITDELRLATNFNSKSIGIALKDRGAILPAGHSANAAYWFDNSTGGWITSTYYMNELPDWVKKVNDKKLPDQYLAQNWNTLYPIETYKQSTEDNKPYESNLTGEDNTFPHTTASITGNKYEAFRGTPYGNTFTFDLAKAAIDGEKLGQRGVTDFLAVSFSSTDYVGHAFGPNSIEVEDTYLRFDKELAAFYTMLDAKLGKGQYLVFLTADHGAAHVPNFMKEHNIPAGAFDDAEIRKWLNENAEKKFGVKNAIETVMNYQLYLNYAALETAKVDQDDLKKWAIKELSQHPAIMSAFDLHELAETTLPSTIKERVMNGYNQKLSGDIQFVFMPQWFDGGYKGTTHGTWNPYDAHIPMVWFGWKIKPGKTNRETHMTDFAPTVAALLHIQMPNGNVGHVVEEITK
ncbi:alkaline phosphatase family protein [Terrimonas sp. NA20]|uniref:Alkaline phosphatase family protein n=1 Tax=Terrimonas ginsenosidimutans TaxID=2908004 RepID=A0ABS9KY97_9BACT|nr:alkaline phosphatase PafA [Terrimonas ginsenosidimutans]MCG2617322.1 alkaline phosphatase family protein [Terrimonas ginsenosidimutans]